MFPSIAQTWPQMMYHADKAPIYVKDPLEKELRTREGYSATYIKRSFPVMMYHEDLEPRKAHDPSEKAAMEAEGWTTKHALVKQPTHEMNADGKMVPMPDRHLPIPRADHRRPLGGALSGNSQSGISAQGAIGGTMPGNPVEPVVPVTPLSPVAKNEPAKK